MKSTHPPTTRRLRKTRFLVAFVSLAALGAGLFLAASALAQNAKEGNARSAAAVPENLGLGLRELVQSYQSRIAAKSGPLTHTDFESLKADFDLMQSDDQDRVLVDIYLDGSVSVKKAVQNYEAMGLEVIAALDWYRSGLLSAWMPMDQAVPMAKAAGVSAIQMAQKPKFESAKPKADRPASGHPTYASPTGSGATASQGRVIHKTLNMNQLGYSGQGITVGALSDSYDTNVTTTTIRAANDVTTGDLPGLTNPDGYLTPVTVLVDSANGTDEGRGMLQIIHDLAPASPLAFATANPTQAVFAQNIMNLQAVAGCKVICDDVTYFAEPMFSDGPIAQAIDTVSAAGVSYFSSSGNDGGSGYGADFNRVANDATAQSLLTTQGVNYSGITAAERNVIESFHRFGTDGNGNPILVQNVIVAGSTNGRVIFQWDDPFSRVVSGVNQVTTDYDILVFDASGAYQSTRSGTANNPSTNQPIEQPSTQLTVQTAYKICIVRTNRSVGAGVTRDQATHLRYAVLTNDGPVTGDFLTTDNVNTYGHHMAATGNGMAAYVYDVAPNNPNPHTFNPQIEGFSSNGPCTVYFDKNGVRIPGGGTVRKQPMFSACDGVNTTFFPPSLTVPNPNDYELDGFPNFFGTSAAAPHGAGVAAVVLSAAAANNVGPLTPQDMRNLLSTTTQGQADQDGCSVTAVAGPVSVTASGSTRYDRNFFRVKFNGATGQQLTQLVIDLTNVGIHFNASAADGTRFFAFTTGYTTGSPAPTIVGTPTLSGGPTGRSIATVTFANFTPGSTLNFGVGRVLDTLDAYGQNADLIGGTTPAGGATITATVSGNPVSGTFVNQYARKWNVKSGYGLLDAQAAVNKLLPPVATKQ